MSKINKSLLNWFETNENAENIADFYQKNSNNWKENSVQKTDLCLIKHNIFPHLCQVAQQSALLKDFKSYINPNFCKTVDKCSNYAIIVV